MSKKIFQLILLLLPVLVHAQKQDCKYEKFKDPVTGKAVQMITAPTKLGKFIVGRKDDSLVVFYSMKLLFAEAQKSNNTIVVRLDSILFVFDDQSLVNIPVNGIGYVVNKVVLRPELENINFGFVISPSNVKHFTERKITAFRVYGEKDSRTSDGLNDKQGEKFSKAVDCFL